MQTSRRANCNCANQGSQGRDREAKGDPAKGPAPWLLRPGQSFEKTEPESRERDRRGARELDDDGLELLQLTCDARTGHAIVQMGAQLSLLSRRQRAVHVSLQ